MYAVIEGAVNKIDLQAYSDHGMEGLLESGGFAPTDTLTPKSIEVPTTSKGQSGKLFDLSVIEEESESVSGLTHEDFKENRKKFKETLSISSVGESSQEITKEEVNRAYKKKNACSQRLTLIYWNLDIEKKMAWNDLEKEAIDEFYEEYRFKYVRKLESWQEVIDMYAEQGLQKAEEDRQNWEKENKQQKARTTMLKVTASQKELSVAEVETEIKDYVALVFDSLPSTRATAISVPTAAVTHLVLSTHMVPSPSIVESRAMITSPEVIQQREQSRVKALRAAASLRWITGPVSSSQVTVTLLLWFVLFLYQ